MFDDGTVAPVGVEVVEGGLVVDPNRPGDRLVDGGEGGAYARGELMGPGICAMDVAGSCACS